MTAVTLNGNTYNDTNTPPLNMGNGGHRTNLLPMLSDAVIDLAGKAALATTNGAAQVALAATEVALATTQAGNASTSAGTATTQAAIATTQAGISTTQASNAAVSAAEAAASAASLHGTSTTSLPTTVASKVFTTQANEAYTAGVWITATSAANIANWMYGQVVSYAGTTLTVDVQVVGGNGTYADWNLSISAARGVIGPTGLGLTPQAVGFAATGGTTPHTLTVDVDLVASDIIAGIYGGLSIVRSARTTNTILAAADSSTLIDITSGTFTQTFAAAAALGNGWFCYIRNSGSGIITLDPNALELIDGSANLKIYGGGSLLITCDGTEFNIVYIGSIGSDFNTVTTSLVVPGTPDFSKIYRLNATTLVILVGVTGAGIYAIAYDESAGTYGYAVWLGSCTSGFCDACVTTTGSLVVMCIDTTLGTSAIRGQVITVAGNVLSPNTVYSYTTTYAVTWAKNRLIDCGLDRYAFGFIEANAYVAAFTVSGTAIYFGIAAMVVPGTVGIPFYLLEYAGNNTIAILCHQSSTSLSFVALSISFNAVTIAGSIAISTYSYGCSAIQSSDAAVFFVASYVTIHSVSVATGLPVAGANTVGTAETSTAKLYRTGADTYAAITAHYCFAFSYVAGTLAISAHTTYSGQLFSPSIIGNDTVAFNTSLYKIVGATLTHLATGLTNSLGVTEYKTGKIISSPIIGRGAARSIIPATAIAPATVINTGDYSVQTIDTRGAGILGAYHTSNISGENTYSYFDGNSVSIIKGK